MLNFAWTLQGDYLFTVLRIAFGLSVETATRVQNFYSFFSVIAGVLVGAAVSKDREETLAEGQQIKGPSTVS